MSEGTTAQSNEMPASTIMMPIVGIIISKKMLTFLRALFNRCFGPNRVEEKNIFRVTGYVKLLAAFISIIIYWTSVLFIFRLHDVTECDKYICPKARFLGPNHSDPYVNHTVDFYRCEEQKYFLKSFWGDLLFFFGPAISGVLACSTLIVTHITSPLIIAVLRFSYPCILISYATYVTEFQFHFESVSDVMAYVRSAFIIFVLLSFFLSPRFDTKPKFNRMVLATIILIGIVLFAHVGYSGFHLLCGKGSPLLPGYLVSHYCLVFSFSSRFIDDIYPTAATAMCLFIIPPVCPFVIALAVWTFDSVSKDISAIVDENGGIPVGEPSIPRIPRPAPYLADERRHRQRDGTWEHKNPATRRAHSVRGLY